MCVRGCHLCIHKFSNPPTYCPATFLLCQTFPSKHTGGGAATPTGHHCFCSPAAPLGAIILGAWNPRGAQATWSSVMTQKTMPFFLCVLLCWGQGWKGVPVLPGSRAYWSFHKAVLLLFSYLPHHKGLRCEYVGWGIA